MTTVRLLVWWFAVMMAGGASGTAPHTVVQLGPFGEIGMCKEISRRLTETGSVIWTSPCWESPSSARPQR